MLVLMGLLYFYEFWVRLYSLMLQAKFNNRVALRSCNRSLFNYSFEV